MLKFKKQVSNEEDWLNLVRRVQQSVVNSPRQYLTTSAKHDTLELVVSQIFEEFLDEMKYI
jgi:hypothetical protein